MRMTTSLSNLGDDRVSPFWMVWTCGQLSIAVVSPLVSYRFLICFSGLCMALHAFSRHLILCAALIGCTISFFLLIAVCGPSLDSVEGPSLDSVEGCFWLPYLLSCLSLSFSYGSAACLAWLSTMEFGSLFQRSELILNYLPPSYPLGSPALEGLMSRQLMFQLISPLIEGVFRLLGRSSQWLGACLLALFCLFKGACSHCFLVVQGSLFLWFSFLQAWHA